MEQNVTNSTETECQRRIGKPGDSQHQSVESQNDNSKQQIKPSNVASLEAMDEDVICIEDEDEETVSSKTENKTALDKICCIINSAIEQDDVTRSQTPESPSVSGGLPESGVNTVLSDETQPEEIKRCKVCKTTDRGKDPGGPACDSCSIFFKKCVEDGVKLTRHTVGATVCHCQLCRLLRCYFVGMEPKDSSFVVCLICGKAFLSWYFLKQHLGKCKKSTSTYYCANCEREFVTECQHRLHKKSVFFCKKRDAESILKYKCDICWRSFSSLGVLIMHRYTHIKLDKEMLEMENSLEMHPFQNDPENPIVINDSNRSKARGNKQGDTWQGKKLNKNQMTLLSQLDCSLIDINQDEYLCLKNSSDPQCRKPENCDEMEDTEEILKPENVNLESRNTTQIVLSHEKNFGKDDTYLEKKTSGEGESSQVCKKDVCSDEKDLEPLDSCNGIRTLKENRPTILNDVALQGRDNSGPDSSVTGTKTCSEIMSKSETMKDDLLIDDEEDENDYILVDFDSSDEDEKDSNVDDKNDSSESLGTLPKIDAFTVKNETVCDSLTKTTSTTEQEVSSPALIEEESLNPTLNYSTGGDDQLNETLPDNKDRVKEEILRNQSNGEIINQSNGEIKKNLSESKVPVNIKQENADWNEFSVSQEQIEGKSQSSSLNADTALETSTSQSGSILELISAVLPSSSGESSLTSHQSRIQSLINQLGLKSKVEVTLSEDGTKKVELHFIVNDKMDLESQLAQTNDGSISSTSKDTSNDEVSSTVPDDVDQCLASNGHSSSEQSLLSQVKQAPMKEPQTKEEALSWEVSSTEELKEETTTESAKVLGKEYESGMDKVNAEPPLQEIDESKMYGESNMGEVATPDVIILSSDEEESPVDSTIATTSPVSERPQKQLEMQPKKEGASIVDNSSAEKETDVTSKENLPESEKCVEESNSVDKFSLIRKYLNSKSVDLNKQPSVFSSQDSSNGKRRLSLKAVIPTDSGQESSSTASSSQESNSKMGIECYKCYLCHNIYLDLQELKLHLYQSHSYYQYNENELNSFHCCHCGDEFDSVVKLSIHEMSVHGLKYSCPFCGVFQRSHEQFLKHFTCHFSLIVYYCDSCNREFSKHVRHGCPTSLSRAWKCFLCDRIFFDKENYCNHTILQHSRLFKFTCKACSQNFGTSLALKVHRSSLDNTLDGVQVNIADTITLNANSMEVTVLKETPLTAMHRPYISTPLTSNKQKTTQEAGYTVKSYGNHASLDLSQLPKTLVSIGKKGKLASNIGKKCELVSSIEKKDELASNIGKKGKLASSIEKKDELASNIEKKDELASNIEKKDESASNIGKEGELVKTCTAENVDGLGLPKITRPKKSIPYKGRSAASSSDSPLLVKKTSFCRIRNTPLIMKNVYKSTFTGDVEVVDRGDGDVETETQNKLDRDRAQQICTTINGQKVTITESKYEGEGNAFIHVSNLPNLHMLQSNRMSEKDCHASLKRKSEDSGSSASAIPYKQARQGLTIQGDQISAVEMDDPQKSKSTHGRNSTGAPDNNTISLPRLFNSEIERAYHVPNNGFTPEVIVLDEDEPDGSVTPSPGATASTSGATASTSGATSSTSGTTRSPSATESTSGATESSGATETPGASESSGATASTPGATASTPGDIASTGATSSKSATVSPGESIEDSVEMPSSGNLSKEGKTEETLLSSNLHKRVPERKKRGCEDLSEEVEGVISNLLQFWKKSETITKPNESILLAKKSTVPSAASSISQEDKAKSVEVKSFVSNQHSSSKMSETVRKEMKRKNPLYPNDDIKKKRISEKEGKNEEKCQLGSISSGVDPEPRGVMENNTSPTPIPKETQNMFITKSVLSVIKSNPTLLEESHENLRKKALLPMHPFLKEFTKTTEWKSSSPIKALANVNALLHRRVPLNSLSKPPFSNHVEDQINNQKQKIFSDIIATLERIESLKNATSKETMQKLEAELSKRTLLSEENTSVKSACINDIASRDTMQKLKAELLKRTTLSEEQTSISKPTTRTNLKDSEANKRHSVNAPITKPLEHQIEEVNNLVEKQVSISEPVSKAPINQNEENGLTDEKATVYKPVSKPPVNHTKSELEDAVKRLSSVVQSISKGKIKELSLPESDGNNEAKKGQTD
ncbi:serine-rich adhesin for platelets isoform X2 [Magallana gigas]|uniref:serine-rich adhesin for platelets isoform X2 n=1 Tax=Magallana gigas TaxID=29159 RepID=UPI0033406F79